MKILFWGTLLLVIFTITNIQAQHPLLRCPDQTVFQPKHQPKRTSFKSLYLKYLYYRYEGYVVTTNAPYKGLTFHLKGLTANNNFFKSANLSFGAFTWDFKEYAGRRTKGVLFDCPVYLGWDIRLKNQIYLSAGTTWLEQRHYEGRQRQHVLLNCFIGISGKFTLGNKICPIAKLLKLKKEENITRVVD